MTTEITPDQHSLADAIAKVGIEERARVDLLEVLRRADESSGDPGFAEQVRWPLIVALLRDVGSHRVTLSDGLTFEVGLDSRIERSLLLSMSPRPGHVWEPQTTKLLVALAENATNVVVGGAYIGDQVLPMAKVMGPEGRVHAFEPMLKAFERLVANLTLNAITNVDARRLCLWDRSDVALGLDGHLALASSSPVTERMREEGVEVVNSITISEYASAQRISTIDLIMLDTEGGEEKALVGAAEFLALPSGAAPNLVFEIHRNFVDWTHGLEKAPIVEFLVSLGYRVFAIRDVHGNYPMAEQPVEIIPVDSVYLDGPPHGFNMLAVKDDGVVDRLGLQLVKHVSPKLILEKDPELHHPLGGFVKSPGPA